MPLNSGICRAPCAGPLLRPRWIALAAVLVLTACTADTATAPALNPAPAEHVVLRLDGSGPGVRSFVLFIDGQRVPNEQLQSLDPARIASVEVLKSTDSGGPSEVHITMRQPQR